MLADGSEASAHTVLLALYADVVSASDIVAFIVKLRFVEEYRGRRIVSNGKLFGIEDEPDGTVAIDLDPLSLLCRLAASVPAPRTHTVRYAGVLGSASKLRSRVVPAPPQPIAAGETDDDASHERGCRYRSWAELLHPRHRCAHVPEVQSLVREPNEVRRFLRALGEPTEPPKRAPARGPPYWASRALRIRSSADAA